MVEKKENMTFRILYFFGIFFVVAGHAGGGGFSFFSDWFPFYSFHLGLFVFGAGYFFVHNKEKKILDFIKKCIKKFLIPLYMWNFLYGILSALLMNAGFSFSSKLNFYSLFIMPIYNGHQFALNAASWFIWPLFLVEVIHIFIIKILDDNKDYYFYFFYSILIGFLGVQLAILGYNENFYRLLPRIMYFCPFFSLGMLYHVSLEKKDTLNNYIYLFIVFALALFVAFIFDGFISYTPSWCYDFDNFYHPFIVGFLGIAFWLRISKILVPFFQSNKYVLEISRNTFPIMMHHIFGFFVLNCLFYIMFRMNIIDGFDTEAFKNTVFYLYFPRGIDNFKVLYLIFGFVFSFIILKIQNYVKKLIYSFNLKNIINK